MTRERRVEFRRVELASRYEVERPHVPHEELALLELTAIKPRLHGDTRELDLVHVHSLKESIAVLGLLEPLVVCRQHHLLCGAHRMAALRLLAEEDLLVGPVPARILATIDSLADPRRALLAEVAENEKRRDYTREQIEGIIERLRKAGYHLGRGRPRQHEKAMGPVLEAIIGKSHRRIQQLLSPRPVEKAKDFAISGDFVRLERVTASLLAALETTSSPTARRLRQHLSELTVLIEAFRRGHGR